MASRPGTVTPHNTNSNRAGQSSVAPDASREGPAVVAYAGRLLTMARVPAGLRSGQTLELPAKSIVTPEVRDHLRRQGIGLRIGATTAAAAAVGTGCRGSGSAGNAAAMASPWQVWWHGAIESAPAAQSPTGPWAWLGQWTPQVSGEVRVMDGSRPLAAAIADQSGESSPNGLGPRHLVISQQPWEVQKFLAREHGRFAWCLSGTGPRQWEEAQIAGADILLSRPPLTSWLIRRWVAGCSRPSLQET